MSHFLWLAFPLLADLNYTVAAADSFIESIFRPLSLTEHLMGLQEASKLGNQLRNAAAPNLLNCAAIGLLTSSVHDYVTALTY